MNVDAPSPHENKTLIFKRLPSELCEDDWKQFFNGLGATRSHFFGVTGPYKNCAYAEFLNSEHAWKVLRVLHQKLFFGRRLSLEFFHPGDTVPVEDLHYTGAKPTKKSEFDSLNSSPLMEPVSSSPCSVNFMAAKWDHSLDIREDLFYKYPSVSPMILTNIVRCMVSCPALYIQVLHFMNRLHLPPPFGDSDIYPGTLIVVNESDLIDRNRVTEDVQQPTGRTDLDMMELSSSTESELESDKDSEQQKKIDPLPVSRRRNRANLRKKQTPTQESAERSKLTVDSKPHHVDLSDLFESTVPSKLRIQIPATLASSVSVNDRSETPLANDGFGLLNPTSRTPETTLNYDASKRHKSTKQKVIPMDEGFQLRKEICSPTDSDNESLADQNISDEEEAKTNASTILSLSLADLYAGRLSAEERQNYPVFARGYSAGEPTSRLYIKNLTSSTTEADLYKVFGVFQNGVVKDPAARLSFTPDSSSRFSVRLLTEGRMKGQAFVGLDSDLTAVQALDATNGFLLHDRPMVVQYARGAKAKVDEKSLIQLGTE